MSHFVQMMVCLIFEFDEISETSYIIDEYRYFSSSNGTTQYFVMSTSKSSEGTFNFERIQEI